MSNKFIEAHYCSLESQSNIYGLARFSLPGGTEKLLIASVRGNVISLEFQKNTPCSKALHFTYIPADAEIVCIDAFTKTSHGNGVVIGISFSKPTDNKMYHYLNIYSEVTAGDEFDLDRIVQGCISLELPFMPYRLWHTELVCDKTSEIVFLLSGNDHQVHLYREDRSAHTFREDPVDEFFPEFAHLTSNVIWSSSENLRENMQRLTVIGCQSGAIKMSLVNTQTRGVLKTYTTQHDSAICSVQLFPLCTNVEVPSFITQDDTTDDLSEMEETEVNLLVASAIEPAVVYRNVLVNGFSEGLVLSDSDRYDSVLCAKVADVDFDGENEILLGTYGQELLVYKFRAKQAEPALNENGEQKSPSKTPVRANKIREEKFELLWSRGVSDPILALDHLDLTGDGLNEIIVLSLKGLHVLQSDLEEVSKLCIQRMKQALEQTGQQEDVFKQLLSENLSSGYHYS